MNDDELYDKATAGVRVQLAGLLGSIEAYVSRFVWLSEDQRVAVTLWIAHAWVYTLTRVTPYLFVTSPAKECGKSTLLEVIAAIARKPWVVVEPTEAVVYRKIEKDHPTLLIDEADSLFRDKDDRAGLRAVLNAGYSRSRARIPRCIGKGADLTLKEFDVYCPKLLAGIGEFLPDSLRSRVVPIRLERIAPGEHVEDAEEETLEAAAAPIREALGAWAAGTELNLRPDVPPGLGPRQRDSWRILLAIAETAGGDWPSRARTAAVKLFDGDPSEQTAETLLLAHIRESLNGSARISSEELLRALVARQDGPWAAWWGNDVALDRVNGPAAKLARLLRRFKIEPTKYKIGPAPGDGKPAPTARGYLAADFEQSWRRYLAPQEPASSRNRGTALVDGHIEPEPGQMRFRPESGSDLHGSGVPTSEAVSSGCPECGGTFGHMIACSRSSL